MGIAVVCHFERCCTILNVVFYLAKTYSFLFNFSLCLPSENKTFFYWGNYKNKTFKIYLHLSLFSFKCCFLES